MARSLKKGPYVDEKLMKKIMKAKQAGTTAPINTWSRASTVSPEMVGLTLGIHDGKKHVPVFITEMMVGHRLGEFAPTRVFKGHAKKGKISKVYGGAGRYE